MTMIIDHSSGHGASGTLWKRFGRFSSRVREARRTRREHAMLLSMSAHELRDIGLMRGDVLFGVTSGRGVSRDFD